MKDWTNISHILMIITFGIFSVTIGLFCLKKCIPPHTKYKDVDSESDTEEEEIEVEMRETNFEQYKDEDEVEKDKAMQKELMETTL